MASRRYYIDHGSIFLVPPSLQHRHLRPQWVEDRIHHRHVGPWYSLHARLLRLGEILCSGAIPVVGVSAGTDNHWILLALRSHVHFDLVSPPFRLTCNSQLTVLLVQHLECLLLLLSPGRPSAQHHDCRLRPQHFLAHFGVLWALHWSVRSHSASVYCVSCPLTHLNSLISWTGNFKWTAYAGVPFLLLGTALLIPFRSPDTSVGILVMTQFFCGLGSGLFATCGQLAVMAPVSHQQIAVVMAIWGLFGSIGASIGLAIAGAMWNNILPDQLYNRLPEESKNMSQAIFGNITLQMSFLDGTPEREAVVGAYGDVMRKMVIAGSCFMPLCLLSIFVWRNINVKKLEKEEGAQTKGNVW